MITAVERVSFVSVIVAAQIISIRSMFGFFSKTLLQLRLPVSGHSKPATSWRIFHHPRLFCSSIVSDSSEGRSFTVSYLVDSCGLSPESTLAASKRVNLVRPSKPDSAIGALKSYGFSENQIAKIVRRCPRVLLFKPEKTLLPKFDYLCSVGFSNSDLAKVVTFYPTILNRSLEKHIIPNFIAMRDFFRCERKAVAVVKRCPRILYNGFENSFVPFVKILRENGVTESGIAYLLLYQPRMMASSPDYIKGMVEKTKQMGFNPSSVTFAGGIKATMGMTESTWEKKFDVYNRWGWSREDVMGAFLKNPWCMMMSEGKIMAVMEFLVDKMGYEPSYLLHCPGVISRSLENQIVPRCLILKHLSSRGLMLKKYSLQTTLIMSEKSFLEKFVMPHMQEVPHLLNLYKEKGLTKGQWYHNLHDIVHERVNMGEEIL